MTFNDEPQLLNGTGILFLFYVLNWIDDLFHFLPQYFEEDFLFVREEIIDIGRPAAVGNAYIAHTCGLIAFLPEKPSCDFQHLRFLKTGFTFASNHLSQTIKRDGPVQQEN